MLIVFVNSSGLTGRKGGGEAVSRRGATLLLAALHCLLHSTIAASLPLTRRVRFLRLLFEFSRDKPRGRPPKLFDPRSTPGDTAEREQRCS